MRPKMPMSRCACGSCSSRGSLEKRKLTVYETLERPLVAVLAAMEKEGVLVDRAVLARLSAEFAAAAAEIEKQIYELAGERFNIGSPKQLGDILFGRMGLPGGRKTATGAWSTDCDTLEDLAAQGIELARRVLDWRQLAKLRSTYTDALPGYINPKTGRVHTSYAHGRDLHRAPVIDRSQSAEHSGAHRGGPQIRTAFMAPPGIEAHQRRLQPDRASRAGPCRRHSATEEGLRRRPRHSCHDGERNVRRADRGHGPAVRRRAKAINFGIIYGISAFGLANQLVDLPRGGGRLHQDLFQPLPRHPRLHG